VGESLKMSRKAESARAVGRSLRWGGRRIGRTWEEGAGAEAATVEPGGDIHGEGFERVDADEVLFEGAVEGHEGLKARLTLVTIPSGVRGGAGGPSRVECVDESEHMVMGECEKGMLSLGWGETLVANKRWRT
jgi:hypothetical protein